MKIFSMPDLGEGLPEAEIREWFIKVGDQVETDQPIASVETAKALVDIPAPFNGTIEKLFGEVGETIKTGKPFIGFAGEDQSPMTESSGTVVGAIEESDSIIQEHVVAQPKSSSSHFITPAVRSLARRLNIDIKSLSINDRRVTLKDIEQAAGKTQILPDGHKSLGAVRKAMAISMQKSHNEVVPMTITDDVNITRWFKKEDITLRVIRAMQHAIESEPMLNSHFDIATLSYKNIKEFNCGLAIDTEHGLYVPVIPNVEEMKDDELRHEINQLKEQAQRKSIALERLKSASIVLSNFGSFAARYGTPIITPPTVCIVGAGRVYEAALSTNGKVSSGHLLPISISADHRCITGGEVTRFLKALKNNLA